MSTQEVPEWLATTLHTFAMDVAKADESTRGFFGVHRYEFAHKMDVAQEKAVQTILSHMIDKQTVVKALDKAEHGSCSPGRTNAVYELRQALNLNGDE